MSINVWRARIAVVVCGIALIVWSPGIMARSNVQARGTTLPQSQEPATAGSNPWKLFASFADAFDKADPSQADSISGWTPNCAIWPRSLYCVANGENILGPPISEFDFNLPFHFSLESSASNPAPPPFPILGTTVLYNENAKNAFSKCKAGSPIQVGDPCQYATAIDRPVMLVRAMWAEVNSTSSAIVYIQKDFDQCNPSSNWTTACPNMRRSVNINAVQNCNMKDYPWKGKPIDLGCFPHILVTAKNMNLFQLRSGNAHSGDYMILLAFHIMQLSPSLKTPAEWKQSTFWWQARPSDSHLGSGCPYSDPCSRLGNPWRHFRVKSAVLPKNMGAPIPSAYNPFIEAPTGAQKKISCAICHAFAGSPTYVAGEASGTGLSTGISRSALDQKVQAYLKNYNVAPSANVWSLAFGVEAVVSNVGKENPPKSADRKP